MNNYLSSSRLMFGAAIVGIVGAAGVFIYEQMYAEKRRAMLVREVAKLNKQVTSMRTELESLRELQKEHQIRRQKQKKRLRPPRSKPVAASGDAVDGRDQSYASDSEYFTDYQSVIGTDVDSEEFYDVNTDEDEDNTLRESSRNDESTLAIDDLEDDNLNKTDTSESPKKTSS